MALLTDTQQFSLNYSYQGQPFCVVGTKSTMTPNTLDIAYQGQPFYFVAPAAGGGPSSAIKSFGGISYANLKKIGGIAIANIKKVLNISNQ